MPRTSPRRAGVSSLHSNVAPASDENVNDGAVPLVGPVGPPLIVVSGAAVSTVNARAAGETSMLPAASRPRPRTCTRRSRSSCRPAATCRPHTSRRPRGCRACTRTSRPPRDVNVNDGAVTFVTPVGPPVINVSGAAVSTVNALVAGDRIGVPAIGGSGRERVRAVGGRRVHLRRRAAAYVPAPAGASSLHSNVEPALDDVNVNDGAVTFVVPVGPPVMSCPAPEAASAWGSASASAWASPLARRSPCRACQSHGSGTGTCTSLRSGRCSSPPSPGPTRC